MRYGRGEGMMPLVFYCSARDETGRLDLGKQGEKKVFGQPTWFSDRHGLWFSGRCLLELEDEIQTRVGRGSLVVDSLWDPQEMCPEGREGCTSCSVAVLGTRLGNWVWGNAEKGEGLQAVNLLLWQT